MLSRLGNLKKQLLQKIEALENRFHQSDVFNTFKEKFQSLPHKKQQIIKYSSLGLCFLGVFGIPFGYFYSSSGYLREFKEKESLSLELLKTGNQSPSFLYQKTSFQVKSLLKNIVEKYQKEEYSITERGSVKAKGLDVNSSGVELSVKHLNIKQAAALGGKLNDLQFIRIHKLKMTENVSYKNHYDMHFSILFFPPPKQKTSRDKIKPTDLKSRRK